MDSKTSEDYNNPGKKWYDPDPPNIKPETREVFEKYSKIPPDEVLPHVQAIVNCTTIISCRSFCANSSNSATKRGRFSVIPALDNGAFWTSGLGVTQFTQRYWNV